MIYNRNRPEIMYQTILCTMGQGLGNLVQKTPSIKALRQMYPNAKIDLLIHENQKDILEGWEIINDIYTDSMSIGSYELVVNFTPPYFGKGFEGKIKTVSYDRDLLKTRPEWKVNLDEVLKLRKKVEIKDIHTYFPKVEFKKEKNCKWVGIAHGCGTDWLERKDWGVEKFGQLINELLKIEGLEVFIFGKGKRDKEIEKYLPDSDRVINYIDELNIKETSGIISKLDCIIGNDTGLLHIASALKVPSVAFFGASSIVKNKPFYGCRVVSKRLECAKYCQWEKGCEDLKCLDVSVEDMLKPVKQILGLGITREYRFGIWMTCHNRFEFLAPTLKSIIDTGHDFTDYKFYFLDDCSSDLRVINILDEVKPVLEGMGAEVDIVRHEDKYGKERYGDSAKECFAGLGDCEYYIPIQDDFLLNRYFFECAEKSTKYLDDKIKMVYLILHEAKSGCYSPIGKGIGNIGSYHEWWTAVWSNDLVQSAEIENRPCATGSGSGHRVAQQLHENGWQCARLSQSVGIHLGFKDSAMNCEERVRNNLYALNPILFGKPEFLED